MNAEDVNSDRDDANNTQFELGKLIAKRPLAAKELDDAAKNVTQSKKNLDNVENAIGDDKSELPVCRICLMEENEIDNPLFAPCKCSGSMRHIHHGCLKTWFHNKRIMK